MNDDGRAVGTKPGVVPCFITEPDITPATQPFWAAAREGRLVVSRCTTCGTFRLPPTPRCFICQHDEVAWVELTGRGTVYSFTIVRHPLGPQLQDVVPYVSGVIELDGTQGAGSRMAGNIIECDVDDVHVDMRVEIIWDHVNDRLSVPRFRPAAQDQLR